MESTTARKKNRPFYLRRSVQITVTALVLLFMATLILVPYGIGYGIKRGILENGGERVTLSDVNFNPFTATLELYELEVEAEGTRRLLLPHLDLHLRWLPLWKGRIVVEGITARGIRALIDWPQAHMLRVGGVMIDMSTSGPTPEFAIDRLRVLDSDLEYRDSNLDTKARIERLQLTNLTNISPDRAAMILLDGLIDGARLKVQGQAMPFAAEPRFDGGISLEGLGLKHYAKLAAPDIGRLQGDVVLDTRITMRYRQDSTLNLIQEGALSLGGMEISAKDGNVLAKKIDWKGRLQLDMQAETGALRLSTDGRLVLGPGHFSQGPQGPRGEQGTLQWQGHIGIERERDNNKVALEGDLSAEGLRFGDPAQEMTVDQGSVKWGGKIEVEGGPRQTRVKADGKLEAWDLETTVGDLAVKLAGAELPKLSLDLAQEMETGTDLTHQGELILKSLELDSGQRHTLTHNKLHWKGRSELRAPAQGPWQLTTNGTLASRELDLKLGSRDVGLAYLTLDWKGRIAAVVRETLEDLNGSGALTVTGLGTDALIEQYNILAFDEMQARSIEIQGPEQIGVGEMTIDRLTLGEVQQSPAREQTRGNINLFRSGRLIVKALDFSKDSGLKIDSIEEHDVQSLTWRNREGEWNVVGLLQLLERLAKGDTLEADADATAGKGRPAQAERPTQDARGTQEALPVRVGKILVTGDSRAVFADDRVDPPFQLEARVKRAELRDLDTTRPEHLSPLDVETLIDRDAKWRISGGVAPFAPRLTLDIRSRIEGLPLPPLSSYTEPMIGYRMDSGEMDADIQLQAKAGKITGDNKLQLHGVTVSRLSEERLKTLGAKATVPLDTGLAVLKDRNNTIELDLPLSGDIDEIEVNPGDIINQALAKGLAAGAKTYLAATLFPFGTALVVAQMAGEQVMKVRLDPVIFAPGSSTLNAKDHEYLNKVARLLQDRPGIDIRVCGIATESDRTQLIKKAAQDLREAKEARTGKEKAPAPTRQPPAPPLPVLDEQLTELARQRAEKVDAYLSRRSHVKNSRLIECRPEIDNKDAKKVKPRVDLLI